MAAHGARRSTVFHFSNRYARPPWAVEPCSRSAGSACGFLMLRGCPTRYRPTSHSRGRAPQARTGAPRTLGVIGACRVQGRAGNGPQSVRNRSAAERAAGGVERTGKMSKPESPWEVSRSQSVQRTIRRGGRRGGSRAGEEVGRRIRSGSATKGCPGRVGSDANIVEARRDAEQ